MNELTAEYEIPLQILEYGDHVKPETRFGRLNIDTSMKFHRLPQTNIGMGLQTRSLRIYKDEEDNRYLLSGNRNGKTGIYIKVDPSIDIEAIIAKVRDGKDIKEELTALYSGQILGLGYDNLAQIAADYSAEVAELGIGERLNFKHITFDAEALKKTNEEIVTHDTMHISFQLTKEVSSERIQEVSEEFDAKMAAGIDVLQPYLEAINEEGIYPIAFGVVPKNIVVSSSVSIATPVEQRAR